MNKLKQITCILAVLTLAMMTTACNDEGLMGTNGSLAIKSGNSGLGGGGIIEPPPANNDDGEVDMAALDAELDVVEEEMAKLESEMAALNIGGLGNSNSSVSSGLDKALRTIFEKLIGGVEKAREKVDELGQQIQDRMAQLDPTNPLHLIAIQKLQEAMGYLGEVNERIDEQILRLVGVIDGAVSRVDEAVSRLDPLVQVAVSLLWEPLKGVIFEYRERLLQA